MRILYLCEKPSQARDIAQVLGGHQRNEGYFLGGNFIVTWCVGHLLEMAMPEHYCAHLKPWRLEVLPVIPDKWQVNVVDKTKKQFNIIKKLLKETKEVIIATDADREGEVIAREILELCSYRGRIQRLWLSALDEASIKKALENLKQDYETEKLYAAGVARQRADWLVGMNLTMAATCLFGKQEVLSVGRVQTPTLKLVVDRDRIIKQFQPKDYFILKVKFSMSQKESFWANWQVPSAFADEAGRCLNLAIIQNVANKLKGNFGTIEMFNEIQKQQSPPLGLSLSGLQKLASSQFGFSAKQTLEVAQSLYETHKTTTYPRTDCHYLPENQWNDAKLILQGLVQINTTLKPFIEQCHLSFKSPIWNDKKITAHHAIIPTTNAKVHYQNLTREERQLYDLICRYYIAQFLGNFIYMSRTVTVRINQELFKASCHIPLELGWRRILNNPLSDSEAETEQESVIPLLKNSEQVLNEDGHIETHKTKPPQSFTEGTLIEAMKTIGKLVADAELKKVLKDSAGIGTEATRANILETLIKRGYLIRQGKTLLSTSRGQALVDLLPTIISDPATTAQWEQELDMIAQGAQSMDSFLSRQADNVKTMLAALAAKRCSILPGLPSKPTGKQAK